MGKTNYTEEDFNEMIKELMENPEDFLSLEKLNKFIHGVPYGTIDDDLISEAADKLKDINATASASLRTYSINQSIELLGGLL